MKWVFTLAIILVCVDLRSQNPASDYCFDMADYRLYMQDEFDGSHIDTGLWYTYIPQWHMESTGEISYSDDAEFSRLFHGWQDSSTLNTMVYLDRNVEVNNGICRLITKRENTEWMGHLRPLSSATLYSKKPLPYYAVYEMRARIPYGKNLSYAYWVFTEKTGENGMYGSEIDFFEFWNSSWLRRHKFESNVYNWIRHHIQDRSHRESRIDKEEWHIYRCVVSAQNILIYIDDMENPALKFSAYTEKSSRKYPQEVFTCHPDMNNLDSAKFFPHYQMNYDLIIGAGGRRSENMAGRGQWIRPGTPDSVAMEIDYIRVYVPK